MIILDTNQLVHAKPPAGPLLNMLKAIADHTGHALALPEIALEEHLAHERHDVEELHRAAQSAMRDLGAKLQMMRIEDLPAPDIDQHVQQVRAQLSSIFKILPTPEGAAREALVRETRRQAPAKRSWEGKGEGARDVAIWLTAVDAMAQSSETVYFVSMDKTAFGKEKLLQELKTELGDAGAEKFRYCYGIEALLAELATVRSGQVKPADIGASDVVRQAVLKVTFGADFFFHILVGSGLTGEGHIASRAGGQELSVSGPAHVVSYEVDGRTWTCARVRWDIREQVTATFIDSEPTTWRTIDVSFQFSTTLLMEVDGDGRISRAEVVHLGEMRSFKAAVLGS